MSKEWEGAQLWHSCCGPPKPSGATEASRSLACQGSCAVAADRAVAEHGWLLILETDFLVHVMTLLLLPSPGSRESFEVPMAHTVAGDHDGWTIAPIYSKLQNQEIMTKALCRIKLMFLSH